MGLHGEIEPTPEQRPIGSAKAVESKLITDVYMAKLDSILNKIDKCRGQNNSIMERLSFVLNNNQSGESCEGMGAKGDSKEPHDDLMYRLHLIEVRLHCLADEQISILKRTEY